MTQLDDRPTGAIALAHDWLCGLRGGEAVLERIALARERLEPDTLGLIYTMFDDGRPMAPAIDRHAHAVSSLGRLPGAAGPLRRWMLPLYPAMVGQLSRRLARTDAKLLVSTSSAAIKGMRTPEGARHLCYCHAPARYVWSRQDDYGTSGLRAAGLRMFGPRFRAWDKRTASNVTRFLANSTHIARQIERCYGREATVLHPPVDTDAFTPGDEPRGEFWLVVSALEPYKRVDLAIEAARLAGAELVVIGSGSEEARLRGMAHSGVRFEGRVPAARLRELYRTARVFLFPQVEDFGISAVEALACGCPVAARAAGGALDIVEDGVSGALFGFEQHAHDDAARLAEAARRAPEDPIACRVRAERFSTARFDREIEAEMRALLA